MSKEYTNTKIHTKQSSKQTATANKNKTKYIDSSSVQCACFLIQFNFFFTFFTQRGILSGKQKQNKNMSY